MHRVAGVNWLDVADQQADMTHDTCYLMWYQYRLHYENGHRRGELDEHCRVAQQGWRRYSYVVCRLHDWPTAHIKRVVMISAFFVWVRVFLNRDERVGKSSVAKSDCV